MYSGMAHIIYLALKNHKMASWTGQRFKWLISSREVIFHGFANGIYVDSITVPHVVTSHSS